MKVFRLCLSLVLILSGSLALAQSSGEKLGDCLVRKTTGQDRIDLVRWIVLAYSKHPDVSNFVQTDATAEENVHQNMGLLFTELVAERCKLEARTAFQSGNAAFEQAFTTLGQVAAEELMRSKEVNSTIADFVKYADQKKIEAALE